MSLKYLTGNQLDQENQATLGIQMTHPEECLGSPEVLGPDQGLGPEGPCQDPEVPGSDPGPKGPGPAQDPEGQGPDPEGTCPEGQGPHPGPDISIYFLCSLSLN